MARSISEIYNALIDEKETLDNLSELQPNPDQFQTFLHDLTSSSKVAIWRLMLYVVAYGHWIVETLFDRHEASVIALKYILITGTPRWYQQKALEFQYGDSLIWNGSQYTYATINVDNQIVKRSAVVVSGGITRIKAAKLDEDDITPIPLTAAENVSFTAYMQAHAFAGVNIIIISTDPDDVIINAVINYDPLVLTPNGELINEGGVFPAVDAINSYLSNLPFNGVFNKNKLVDAMQSAEGVVDPVLGLVQARYGQNNFSTIINNYTSFAGHMTVYSGQDLSVTLTYIEAVNL